MGNLWQGIKNFSEEYKRKNISAFAASTAFFIFLSLVPVLIVICAIIPYTPLTGEVLLKAISDLVPVKLYPLVEEIVQDIYERAGNILPIAAVVTFLTAGNGMLALRRGLNAVEDVKETRNYLWVRMVSTFYTGIFLVMILISLFVMVFGNRFVDMLLYKMPQLQSLVAFLMNFRFLVVWVLLTLLFAAIFAYVPNGRLKFRSQIPGAAFTAIGWGVFSWGFSLYVDWTDFSIYGSLTLIVLIMLWTYACMYIALVGAFLNRYCMPKGKKNE